MSKCLNVLYTYIDLRLCIYVNMQISFLYMEKKSDDSWKLICCVTLKSIALTLCERFKSIQIIFNYFCILCIFESSTVLLYKNETHTILLIWKKKKTWKIGRPLLNIFCIDIPPLRNFCFKRKKNEPELFKVRLQWIFLSTNLRIE